MGIEEPVLAFVALAVALGGIALGYLFYVRRPELPARVAAAAGGLYRASLEKYWVDEAYARFPVGFTIRLSRVAIGADARAVDGAVNGTGWVARRGSLASGWTDFKVVDGAVKLGIAEVGTGIETGHPAVGEFHRHPEFVLAADTLISALERAAAADEQHEGEQNGEQALHQNRLRVED